MNKIRITFNDTPYRNSHLTAPRGRGSWAFGDSPDTPIDKVVYSPSMTYAEARKWMKKSLEFMGGQGSVEIYVLP